jgi:heme/copper-type cytochrome/quinol oxidase subunit 2
MLHLTLGDPEQFWAPLVRDLAAEMQRRGLPMNLEQDQFVETLSRTLWGWVTVLTVLLAMCALFLARWWQSRNGQPGRFGAEFQQLRLGLALGTVAAVTIVVSLLIDRPLAGDLARLFLGALLIVGLAAAHRFKATGRLAGAWLWLIYVLLVLAAPIMVAVLAGWGFIDNWLRSNRPARPENAN